MRSARGMGLGLSDHYVVLCKARLVGALIKRREVVVEARRIRSEKQREHQYIEGYARSLEEKIVEWDGDNNVEHIWEQVKWAMVGSVREVGGKNPKSLWWNDDAKSAVRRKEVLAVSNEEAKERCMKAYREEKRKVKRYI